MFEDIRPYNDAETAAALRRVSNNRLMDQISAFLLRQRGVFDVSSLRRSRMELGKFLAVRRSQKLSWDHFAAVWDGMRKLAAGTPEA